MEVVAFHVNELTDHNARLFLTDHVCLRLRRLPDPVSSATDADSRLHHLLAGARDLTHRRRARLPVSDPEGSPACPSAHLRMDSKWDSDRPNRSSFQTIEHVT